jgi:glucose/arabinose dehydrogenase
VEKKMRLLRSITLIILCVSVAFHFSFARDPEKVDNPAEMEDVTGLEPVQVAGPFNIPWAVAFLPNGSMLVTERSGRLQFIQPGSTPLEVAGLPAMLRRGHAGLFDVAVSPSFSKDRVLYLSYAFGTKVSSTVRVLRAKFDLARKRLTSHKIIFESTAARGMVLYGGRMALTNDGHLFLTLGDRWKREHAQDLANHEGTIIRILTDGSIPQDNPFVSVAEARPEIWSYGHRNQLGLVYDNRTGQLWAHENGPRGGDELNLILPGRNYGWPVITYGTEYSGEPIGEGTEKEGMEQPLHHWSPSIAPSGLVLEDRGRATVFWIGALAAQALLRLEVEDGRVVGEQRLLEGALGRIRDVRMGPDGILYVVTDDAEGALYRLDPVVEQARDEHRSPL